MVGLKRVGAADPAEIVRPCRKVGPIGSRGAPASANQNDAGKVLISIDRSWRHGPLIGGRHRVTQACPGSAAKRVRRAAAAIPGRRLRPPSRGRPRSEHDRRPNCRKAQACRKPRSNQKLKGAICWNHHMQLYDNGGRIVVSIISDISAAGQDQRRCLDRPAAESSTQPACRATLALRCGMSPLVGRRRSVRPQSRRHELPATGSVSGRAPPASGIARRSPRTAPK